MGGLVGGGGWLRDRGRGGVRGGGWVFQHSVKFLSHELARGREP